MTSDRLLDIHPSPRPLAAAYAGKEGFLKPMNHDFSQFVKNCEGDKNAILDMGEVLVGSKSPFLVACRSESVRRRKGYRRDSLPSRSC